MKKVVLIFACFYVNVVYGQTIYTSEDHFSIGESVIYEVNNLVNPVIDFSATGEAFSWDYSELTSMRADTLDFFDPNDSGYRTSYCLANFLLFNCQSKFNELTNVASRSADSLGFGEIQTQNVVRHFKKDESSFSETLLGVTAEVNGITIPAGFEFQNPDVILQFPITFPSQDSSESRLVLDLAPAGIDAKLTRQRIRHNVVEGFGSLTTPAGQYSAVLKMKTTISNLDSTVFDTIVIPISTKEVEYKWFAKGFAGPVMVANGLVIGGNEVISEVRYQTEAEFSSVNDAVNSSDIQVYPNPFEDVLQLRSGKKGITSAEVINRVGQRVYSREVNATDVVIKELIDPGIYYIVLTMEEGTRHIRKVVKL